MNFHFRPLYVWAARDLLRRPGEALLLTGVLALVIMVAAAALLLTRALSDTALKIIDAGPSLVIRRTGPGGWQPMEAQTAVAAAAVVAGVIHPRPRVWGLVRAGDTQLTLVGMEKPAGALANAGAPGRGQAIAGPAAGCAPGDTLILTGQHTQSFTVIATFERFVAAAVQDVVLVGADDARKVLGLPPGYATDLAVDVFHDGEQDAILPDLLNAFEFPVRIATRQSTAGWYAASYAMRGGLFMTALIPSVLALVLIMIYSGREGAGRKQEIGLLKSMGWTTKDIAALQMTRAAIIGLAASAIGMAAAYALVFFPGATWPAAFFFGWQQHPPALFPDPAGALAVLVQVCALVVAPFAAAGLLSALRYASAAPMDMIDGEA